jgi:hypothetical protein
MHRYRIAFAALAANEVGRKEWEAEVAAGKAKYKKRCKMVAN